MAEAAARQQKRIFGANFWWVAIPSPILFGLNAAFVTLTTFGVNLGVLESQDDNLIYLQYLLLLFLVFFVVGALRGRATGKISSAITLTLLACFIGGCAAFIILPVILSLAINSAMGLRIPAGILLTPFLIGFLLSLVLIGFQMVLAAVIGGIGGLIGSRLLHKHTQPEEAPPL